MKILQYKIQFFSFLLIESSPPRRSPSSLLIEKRTHTRAQHNCYLVTLAHKRIPTILISKHMVPFRPRKTRSIILQGGSEWMSRNLYTAYSTSQKWGKYCDTCGQRIIRFLDIYPFLWKLYSVINNSNV